MKVEKHLDWHPRIDNEIWIEEGDFTITLKKDEVEIECSWDYGYGGGGTEYISIPLSRLKELIEELEKSQ